MIAATTQTIFGHPSQEYLNAITIATNQAIADIGVTSIFIMDGINVIDKWFARKP
jgi:hypothetical protein